VIPRDPPKDRDGAVLRASEALDPEAFAIVDPVQDSGLPLQPASIEFGSLQDDVAGSPGAAEASKQPMHRSGQAESGQDAGRRRVLWWHDSAMMAGSR
jgi:hypothetical protein